MENLWAPWRMEYIKASDKTKSCVFCDILPAGNDRERLILWRGESTYCVMNRYPYNPGHLLIIPNQHTDELPLLPTETQHEMIWLLSETTKIVKQVLKAENMNVGMNIGRSAGAGVLGHMHFHVIPRWNGDTNFLPVLDETRSLPEYLDDTYETLYPAFSKLTR